jgi:cytochrome c biogenesis protein
MRPGESWALPQGHGTVTFDGFKQWASFTVAHDPGQGWALMSAIAAITGLALSLLVRRRRVWVKVSTSAQGDTVVEVAGMTRSEHASVSDDVDALTADLTGRAISVTGQ